jgi:hypothetical protein
MLQVKFTQEEAAAYLQLMKKENDIVRLVNPSERCVINLDGKKISNDNCHSFWNRSDRCENCSSLRAL